MRRRAILAAFGGAAAWPMIAHAQRQNIPRLCFMTFDPGTLRTRSSRFDAFFQGLHDLGYQDGRTIDIRYLSAENDDDRFPTLIDECLSLNPAVIAVTTTPAAHLLKKATSILPTERPSGPAGPFPKMFGKLSSKGPKFISAQRVNESRETIAVPDAQQDTIQHYVLHS